MDVQFAAGRPPWRATRPPSQRVIIQRRQVRFDDLSLLLATEDVTAPTDWSFDEDGHTLVVHLAGRLRHMESVFSAGPSSDRLPSVGDVWVIPAGCHYAALAQGDRVQFAEFRVPAHLLSGGDLAARVGHRDPFLHHASRRAAQLAERGDDLGRMALQALLAAVRLHIADLYLGRPAPVPDAPLTKHARRFSQRQRERLAGHIAGALHEAISVEGLAQALGLSVPHLMEGFKATFGTTPWQYVLHARVAEARRLLEHSKASVTAISAAVGFSSPSHFATAFGRHVGLTPTAYRHALRAA